MPPKMAMLYITNIANPLSSKKHSAFQYGSSYEFPALPEDAHKKITKKVNANFFKINFNFVL